MAKNTFSFEGNIANIAKNDKGEIFALTLIQSGKYEENGTEKEYKTTLPVTVPTYVDGELREKINSLEVGTHIQIRGSLKQNEFEKDGVKKYEIQANIKKLTVTDFTKKAE